MKNLIKNTILTAFLALALISCSDDSTSTPQTPVVTKITNNYFGILDVSRVTFRQVRINADNSEVSNTLQEGVMEYMKDTTVFSFNSRLYTKVIQTPSEVKSSEIYHMTADSNEFRIHSASINNVVKLMVPNMGSTVALPFSLPDTLVKIGDRVNNEWNIYSKPFTNFEVTSGIFANGTLTVKGKRGVAGKTTIEGTQVNTQEFIITFVFSGTYQMGETGSPASINLPIELHYVFGENKGIVAYSIPYSILPILIDMPVQGFKYQATSINLPNSVD